MSTLCVYNCGKSRLRLKVLMNLTVFHLVLHWLKTLRKNFSLYFCPFLILI